VPDRLLLPPVLPILLILRLLLSQRLLLVLLLLLLLLHSCCNELVRLQICQHPSKVASLAGRGGGCLEHWRTAGGAVLLALQPGPGEWHTSGHGRCLTLLDRYAWAATPHCRNILASVPAKFMKHSCHGHWASKSIAHLISTLQTAIILAVT